MTNRPICPRGQRKNNSPCIFCQDGSYCAHQYYCSGTRRYENTGYRECRKLKGEKTQSAAPTAPFATGALGNGESEQEVKEVKKVGAKKVSRRKPRKG